MPFIKGKKIDSLTIRNFIYVLIIAILCICLCLYSLIWIIPSIIVFLFSAGYAFWSTSKRKEEIDNHIQDIAEDVSSVSKGNLVNTPIPLVVIETDGSIVWRSKKFTQEFQNNQIATLLNPIVKEIKLDIEKNGESISIAKQFALNNKVYRILGSVIRAKRKDKKKGKEYVLSLYFIDETRYNELFDKYNNQIPCIGLVMIDNYEEISQIIIPEKKSEMLSKVEKEIIDWITSTGGLVIKSDRDSFLFVFDQKYIAEFEKEKFDILDKVKNINVDSSVAVTLSIAISAEGNTNYEKYKSALAAMEILLGRGGDQAVIRKDGKYKFFGGNTLELEKRTKVKARTVSHSIARVIKDSSNVFIMGHKNIDIDAFGSALGMYRLAKTLGKDAYIVSNPQGKTLSKFMEILNQNPEYDEIMIYDEDALEMIDENSLLIVVDTHKTSYVEFPDLLDKISRKIIIDHHRKAPDCIEGSLVSFHEVYASSAAELVTEILQYAQDNVELKLIEAESLYGGIMVDTKNFTFKTGVRTFEAAAYLRKYGVDIIRVKKWFQADLEDYNTIAEIVKKADIINDSIAIALYEETNDNANLICAKAADELLTISNITASFVMASQDGKVWISGRSIGNINVQIILEKLGGGGHITLAGAQLEGYTLLEAKLELIEKIKEYFDEVE